jgi:hypothetical protein
LVPAHNLLHCLKKSLLGGVREPCVGIATVGVF